MKNRFTLKAVCAATILALGSSVSIAEEQSNRYIITKNSDTYAAMSAVDSIALLKQVENAGAIIKRDLSASNGFIAAELTDKMAKALKAQGVQLTLDPVRTIVAESTPYGITMVQAAQVAEANSGSLKVCVTDTGYDLGHEDLPSNSVTGDDNDGNGNDTGNWYNDGHGHGTHVSGTIAAIGNNNLGVVGVNPGNNISIHMVKLFNDAGSWAYGSDLVAAVNQCAASGAKVVSMSIGGGAPSAAEQAAFDSAYANGMLFIAAAGNDGDATMSYPASYDSVMSVAAVDSNKTRAVFSQYNTQVEIAAPGVNVNSTLPNNTYASWNGTSMATPHVSGVAALVWAHYPQCSSAQIRHAMNMTAEDKGSAGRDTQYGYGIVKAKAMFDALAAEGCDVSGGTAPPSDSELQNGVPVTGLSGLTTQEIHYTMTMPADATDISFAMSGGTGDADLYVKFGGVPTTSSYDCRPYATGNNETCTGIDVGGTYYIMIRAYESFSGVSLVGSYTDSGGTNPPVEIDLSVTKRVQRNRGFADLSWTGATTDSVDIYRNGVVLKTTSNNGSYTDNVGKRPSGAYTYEVCDQGTTDCSPAVTVSF
jgi:serine protease